MTRIMLALIALVIGFSALLVLGATQAHSMAPAHPVWSVLDTEDGTTYTCRTSHEDGTDTYCWEFVIHPSIRAV